jgi:hypothetical protein
MLSYLGAIADSVVSSSENRELPPTPPPSRRLDDEKPLSPTHARLDELGGSFLEVADVERKLAALTSQHVNLSHVMNNLEQLLPPHEASNDPFARLQLERKLEEVKHERSGVEKEKMEVGILITRVRRKLDDVEGRGAKDSFIWSRKWGSVEEE